MLIEENITKFVAGMYKVTERLGGGSFGEIYKARNIITGEEVAAKFVIEFFI